jgi:hypothetical protein
MIVDDEDARYVRGLSEDDRTYLAAQAARATRLLHALDGESLLSSRMLGRPALPEGTGQPSGLELLIADWDRFRKGDRY